MRKGRPPSFPPSSPRFPVLSLAALAYAWAGVVLMMEWWTATLMGTLAGTLGTGAGGALAFTFRDPSKRFRSALLSATAGMMLAVVCFELLPEAFEAHSMGVGLIGLGIGVAFVVLMDAFLVSRATGNNPYRRAGILMAAGIAVHNFPEGLAIGAGYAAAPALGLGIGLVILLHDLPEGLAIGIPMREGGEGFLRVLGYAILSGLPTGIGALAGFGLGQYSALCISLSMGIAGGAMLYLTCAELIPQSNAMHKGRINGIALAAGVALGILATTLAG